eukprot:gene13665-biopygen5043
MQHPSNRRLTRARSQRQGSPKKSEFPQRSAACEFSQRSAACEFPQRSAACEFPQRSAACEFPQRSACRRRRGRRRGGVCGGGWESIAEVDSACAATNTARAATREG